MSHVYGTMDIIEFLNYVSLSQSDMKLLSSCPLRSNYLIENGIVPGKGIVGTVIKVFDFLIISNTPLKRHMQLNDLQENCLIELSDDQYQIINKYSNTLSIKCCVGMLG